MSGTAEASDVPVVRTGLSDWMTRPLIVTLPLIRLPTASSGAD
ncbi:hypothetical protein [Kitasatospora aureofaciens]